MADVKISALPAATTPLAGTEVLPIVQSATTKQVSIANVTAGRAISASSLTLTTPLSAANGGTGLSSLGTGVATALGNATNGASGLAVLDGSGYLSVAQGGTGLGSLTAGYIPYGNGTGAFSNSANLTFDGSSLNVSGTSNTTFRQLVVRNLSNGSGAYSVFNIGNDTFLAAMDIAVLSSTNTNFGGASSGLIQSNIGNMWLGTSAAYSVQFATNGSEKMRIDASGNVAIGTTNTTSGPSSIGGLTLHHATGTKYIKIGNYVGTGSFNVSVIESMGSRNDGNGSFYGRLAASYCRLDGTAIQAGAGLGGVLFGGQWGTNTSYTAANLLYAASIKGVAESAFTSATTMSTGIAFYTGSTGDSAASVNLPYGTERMRLDASGRLGLGAAPDNTLSPKLYVSSAFSAATAATPYNGLYIVSSDAVAADKGGVISLGGAYSGSTDTRWAAIAGLKENGTAGEYGGYLAFYTRANTATPAERMRITSDGKVGVNTTSPAAILDVMSGGTSEGAYFKNSSGDRIQFITPNRGTTYSVFGMAAGTPAIAAIGNATSLDLGIGAYGNNLIFGTVNTERARIDGSGNFLIKSTGGIGYGTGSGGAVTQATSRTTGVTLNKTNGAITLVSAAGSATWQSFTVTNSTVAATDTIIVNQNTGTDLYQIFVTNVAAGSFRITFATTGGTTTEQPVFNFAVIKAVTA